MHRPDWILVAMLLFAAFSPAAPGQDWEFERVDDAFNTIGSSVSIVVDSAGVPHIANGAHRSGIIRYAVKLGDEWLVEEADVGQTGLSVSIALDSDENPALAYFSFDSGSLTIARLIGRSWTHETVDAMQFDNKTSLRFAGDGTPHVAYGKFGSPWNIKHAFKSDGSWHPSTVDSTTASGVGIAMVLDQNDTPHITHWGAPQRGDGPFHRKSSIRLNDGSWTNDLVDDSGENCNVIHNGIALDATGDTHIVYMSNSCFGASEVKYAVGSGENWDVSVVDSVGRSAGVSLVLDRSGSPHIVYGTRYIAVGGSSDLRYAHLDADGRWSVEAVDRVGDAGELNSLAIDERGHLHIAYFRGDGTDQTGELRYARRVRPVGGLPGDLNCDGQINAFDIEPFLVALFAPDEYPAQYPDCDINLADVNADGDINTFDIEPFLMLLLGP